MSEAWPPSGAVAMPTTSNFFPPSVTSSPTPRSLRPAYPDPRITSRALPDEKYSPFVTWPSVTAPRPGCAGSTPLTLLASKSMFSGGPGGAPPPGPKPWTWSWVCSGTVPETVTRLSVSPPAASLTPSIADTLAARDEANESCGPDVKFVRVNFSPGSPRSSRLWRTGPPSRSRLRRSDSDSSPG
jgi:hypothetical protein